MKRFAENKQFWLRTGVIIFTLTWTSPLSGEVNMRSNPENTLPWSLNPIIREITVLWRAEQFEASLLIAEDILSKFESMDIDYDNSELVKRVSAHTLFAQLIFPMDFLDFKATSNIHSSIPVMKNPKSAHYRKRFLDILEKIFSLMAISTSKDTQWDNSQGLYIMVRDIEALIACGRSGFVCPWLDETVKKLLDSPKYSVASIDAQKFLLRAAFVGQFCGDEKNNTPEIRAANMVELAQPYVEEPWLPEFLEDFALSYIWCSGLYGLEGQYAYLTAFEPLFKDRPGKTADSFYVRLTITARKLQNHEAVIRWCNIVLARRGNTGEGALEYNRILYEAGEALRRERNEPHPHEEDLKMFEELGL